MSDTSPSAPIDPADAPAPVTDGRAAATAPVDATVTGGGRSTDGAPTGDDAPPSTAGTRGGVVQRVVLPVAEAVVGGVVSAAVGHVAARRTPPAPAGETTSS